MASLHDPVPLLARLLDAHPESVQVFEASGRTVYVNRAWRELWAVGDDVLAWYNVLQDPILEANGLLPLLRRAFQTGERVELPALRYDPSHVGRPGNARWVGATAYGLLDGEGRVEHVVIAHRELDAPGADDSLRAQARFQQGLLDALSDAGWCMAMTTATAFTYVNPAFTHMLGYAGEEALRLSPLQVFAPRSREDVLARRTARAKSGAREDRYEAWVVAKSGEEIPVEVSIKVLDEGFDARTIVILHDLRPRERAFANLREAHEALLRSERRFRSLATASVDMIWTTGPDGMIDDLPEWRTYTGQTREEVRGEGWLNAVHPEDRERVRATWWRAAQERRLYECTYRVRARDGTYRHFEARGVAVLSPEGDVEGYIGTWTDVTQRRELEERLRGQQEQLAQLRSDLALSDKMTALGSLVSGVAHELRTPLAYLANHAYLVLRRLEHARDAKEAPSALYDDVLGHQTEVLDAVDRINRLVADLRRFVRLPATGELVEHDFAEVAQEAARLFSATNRGGVRLETRIEGPLPARVERVQVQQVLLNLVENARDASPPDGSVLLMARRDGSGGTVVEVSDKGRGIPAEVQARMWEPFFTTKPEGTGLGLSIVKRILDGHGASIACESAPGRGTTFRIVFPAA